MRFGGCCRGTFGAGSLGTIEAVGQSFLHAELRHETVAIELLPPPPELAVGKVGAGNGGEGAAFVFWEA
jgi:hypothetical protein